MSDSVCVYVCFPFCFNLCGMCVSFFFGGNLLYISKLIVNKLEIRSLFELIMKIARSGGKLQRSFWRRAFGIGKDLHLGCA